MFRHPKVPLHPEAPVRLQNQNRYDFGEAIFGQSSAAIKSFLEKEGQFEGLSSVSLAKQIRKFIYDRLDRKKYVSFASDYLRGKKLNLGEGYDVILVGAGVHAATYLYSAKKKDRISKR